METFFLKANQSLFVSVFKYLFGKSLYINANYEFLFSISLFRFILFYQKNEKKMQIMRSFNLIYLLNSIIK